MFVSKYTSKTASCRKSSLSVVMATATVLAIGVAGCRGHSGQYAELKGTVIADSAARHAISVSKAPVQMDIEVPRGSSGLTNSQASHLKAFAARYRSEGEGQIVVSAPSGGSNEYAVVNAVSNVRQVIHGLGISGHAISMEPYYVSGNSDAPIKVSFTTLVAKGPDCGRWTDSLSNTRRNTNYHNYGCAQQKNLAAMVANPKDLLGPGHLDPRDSGRRDNMVDKWIDGKPTGADRSRDERSGTISKIAK